MSRIIKPELALPAMEVPLTAETARSLLELVSRVYGATHPRAPYGRKAVARIHQLIGTWELPTGPGIVMPGRNNTAREGELVTPATAEPAKPRVVKNSKGRPKGQKKRRGPKPIERGVQPSGIIVP